VWDREEGKFHFSSDAKRVRRDSGDMKVYKYLSPVSVRSEVEMSLRRIGTDRIDLYQTHWQDPTTPVEDTMDELMKLKKEGKIRAIGASNAAVEHLEQYRKAGQLDSDQESYSMLDRQHEKDLLPYCRRHNIAFIAYSPMARGLLTGKVSPDRIFEEGDQRSDNPRFSRENRLRVLEMLDEFKPLAEKYNVTIVQMVLAWTFHQEGCTHVLAGVRNPKQAVENAGAGDVSLSGEDLAEMNRIIGRYEVA
jgi:aryl-alcohol dehydrogenase-like predicted oxidoreductase